MRIPALVVLAVGLVAFSTPSLNAADEMLEIARGVQGVDPEAAVSINFVDEMPSDHG